MGFLRYRLFPILLIFLYGCTNILVIKNYRANRDSHRMFGSSPDRNFYYNETKSSKLKLNWNSSTHGSYNNTSFVAYDSLLIVSDLGGRISAFNFLTGKKIGEIKYDGEIEQTAVIKKSFLVFIVNNLKEKYSTLVIYDFKTGKEIRTKEIFGKFNNELILIDDFVIAVSDFGKIYKISNLIMVEWEIDLDREIHSNPAADKDHIFISSVNGELIKLNLNNGEIIYENKITGSFQSGITLDENNVYLGDVNGVLYSLKKSTGTINWEFDTETKIVQNPGLDENNIYVGNLSGDLFSINKADGKSNWIVETNGLINAAPLIFDNIIIQPNLFRRLDIFDKSNGEVLNQIEFDKRCRTTPMYYKDRIFIGVDKGEIFCYTFE